METLAPHFICIFGSANGWYFKQERKIVASFLGSLLADPSNIYIVQNRTVLLVSIVISPLLRIEMLVALILSRITHLAVD